MKAWSSDVDISNLIYVDVEKKFLEQAPQLGCPASGLKGCGIRLSSGWRVKAQVLWPAKKDAIVALLSLYIGNISYSVNRKMRFFKNIFFLLCI
jgi:hypothetical protein